VPQNLNALLALRLQRFGGCLLALACITPLIKKNTVALYNNATHASAETPFCSTPLTGKNRRRRRMAAATPVLFSTCWLQHVRTETAIKRGISNVASGGCG